MMIIKYKVIFCSAIYAVLKGEVGVRMFLLVIQKMRNGFEEKH